MIHILLSVDVASCISMGHGVSHDCFRNILLFIWSQWNTDMKMVFLLVFQTTYTPFWKMPYSTSGFANADHPQSYSWLLNTLDMARLRPPSFKLEIPGHAEVKRRILAKISTVKEHLSRQMCRFVNNALLMETLLDLYLNQADPCEIVPTPSQNDQHVARGMASQNLIVTCRSSLNQLTRIAHDHSRYCSSPLFIKNETQKTHASIAKLGCRRLGMTQHSFFWKSSPQLPNGNYLVNDKIFHGYMFSGMRPSHYNRFADGAGLGVASKRSQRKFFDTYAPHIEDVYNDDSETALLDEMALYDIAEEPENYGEEWHGIDIQNDARHGWRKIPRIQVLCALETEVIRCCVINISQRRMITSQSDMRKLAPNGFMITLIRTKSQSGSIPTTATCQSTKWSNTWFNTKKIGCSTRMINGMPWKTWKRAWMLFSQFPNTSLE